MPTVTWPREPEPAHRVVARRVQRARDPAPPIGGVRADIRAVEPAALGLMRRQPAALDDIGERVIADGRSRSPCGSSTSCRPRDTRRRIDDAELALGKQLDVAQVVPRLEPLVGASVGNTIAAAARAALRGAVGCGAARALGRALPRSNRRGQTPSLRASVPPRQENVAQSRRSAWLPRRSTTRDIGASQRPPSRGCRALTGGSRGTCSSITHDAVRDAGLQLELPAEDNFARIAARIEATLDAFPWVELVLLSELATFGSTAAMGPAAARAGGTGLPRARGEAPDLAGAGLALRARRR